MRSAVLCVTALLALAGCSAPPTSPREVSVAAAQVNPQAVRLIPSA